MPWGGDFVSFFPTRGPEFCTEKLSLGRGFWRKKLVVRQSARGGMVTGQIDTCINSLRKTVESKRQGILELNSVKECFERTPREICIISEDKAVTKKSIQVYLD